ncbi:MAG TPA: AAA family ATPase [Microbacteriaceae bacterium]|nr:AAA family ATPase [Microbacteriaceae bacterium]HQX34868.1 AAA family ATPase [Microbacteriaceae bacterium]HRA08186.1 AAA family ATPase [Microbacteriaceae bacterium]
MRVHRLEIEGFGPFRGEQTIDFDQFADDGIFLITGKTGAGKSSVLDAICFALYDGVPRYENTGRRLRSDHARDGEPTRVALEFSTGGERYRVERTPEYQRPKKHGAGFTPQKATANLAQWVDGEWAGLAARAKEVGELLSEIVGLTRDQFLQVILLAQNRFAMFLQADQAQRQALLRTLFGTRRFEDYEASLETRRRDAKARFERGGDGLLAVAARAESVLAEAVAVHEGGEIAHAVLDAAGNDDPGNDPAGLDPAGNDAAGHLSAGHDSAGGGAGASVVAEAAPASLRERLAACEVGALRVVAWVQAGEAGVEAALGERTNLETVANRLELVRTNQVRRDASALALALLEEQGEAIASEREQAHRARAAAAVQRSIDTAEAAAAACAGAQTHAEAAVQEWAVAGEGPRSGHDLDDFIETHVRAAGALDEAVAVEANLPGLEQAVTETEHAQRALSEAIGTAEIAQADGPEQLRALDEGLAAARVHAGTAEASGAAVAELAAAVDAATQAVSLAENARGAHEEVRDRGAELTAASAAVDTLRDLRLRGVASELAEALIEGEACAVCGSLEHPAPRRSAGQPVRQAQIDDAVAHRDECAEREKSASERAKAADLDLAEAQARAGARSLQQLEPLLEAARLALAQAIDAVALRDRLLESRTQLVDEQKAAAATLGGLRERNAASLTEQVHAQRTLTAARAAVSAARGEFASVHARRDDVDRRVARARTLSEAHANLEAAAAAAEAALGTRDAELSAHGFTDMHDAIAARRSDAETTELERRVRHHGEQVAHHKAVLLEPELLALPEATVDVDDARAAASAAAQRHNAAVRGQVRIEGLSRQLHDALDEAARDGAAVAALEAEYVVIERLANSVAGRAPNTHRMKLESFVLAAELEEIVEAANRRLALMSGERYRLEHSDALEARGRQSGLGLSVMDQHTGRTRPTHSLSGGETFLASLALALGLAEVVSARAGGITLDTLFIDEGFGSLDAATLDVAMATLDELRQGGRVVGLISHVEAMKEQIHSQLVIDVEPEGWSTVRSSAAGARR